MADEVGECDYTEMFGQSTDKDFGFFFSLYCFCLHATLRFQFYAQDILLHGMYVPGLRFTIA